METWKLVMGCLTAGFMAGFMIGVIGGMILEDARDIIKLKDKNREE